ncbi:hypothetical protein [uncultured Clostridium sp.]|uniref:hypothetical protein n=1 Tax=uncultured Clostridium sp. TaxID=59620 RepID=UPI0025F015C4|nr:hypothetical protein [uncultured Clostridium sp.]
MAKKHIGKFLTFAAIAGAAAAGISYFLQYKSFHKELDEEFHDFEDDFDEFEDTDDNDSPVTRNYVSLTPDRKAEEVKEDVGEEPDDAEDEEVSALSDETSEAEEQAAAPEEVKAEKEAEVSEDKKETAQADTTVTVEEMTE